MDLRSTGLRLDSEARLGWWLVVEGQDGPDRLVAGPYDDRTGAGWAAAERGDDDEPVRAVYGVRGPGGGLHRRPSPQELAWLTHLGEQLDRLPEDWDAGLADDDPLATLLVEVTAVLAEAGLPLWDATGPGGALGGVCLSAEPGLDGVVVGWRQHDRTSVELLHGADTDAAVQQVMNSALADVLWLRGFEVDDLGGDASGSVVRRAA
ncbi:hypothetical protein JOD57_002011 [Geodermatophilus bullaregiensis]|uniref:hypothetical protein n=1 Tax=Geodermatophilus bullaregiensis TaxID=1564160 RepID=UPI00195E602A|nr:hypothetical protein [Geodermatophilus bullaregiensis]MBM7806174.1 hypothetical protein [Geodermatophilus bullaregiensis]